MEINNSIMFDNNKLILMCSCLIGMIFTFIIRNIICKRGSFELYFLMLIEILLIISLYIFYRKYQKCMNRDSNVTKDV